MVYNQFQPDLVEFGDVAGLGMYEVGHYRQHLAYAQALGARGIYIPDYPVLHMVGDNNTEFLDWLNVHESLHALLRGYAGFAGWDLSALDVRSQEAWMNWEEYHRAEHLAFDQAFGTA